MRGNGHLFSAATGPGVALLNDLGLEESHHHSQDQYCTWLTAYVFIALDKISVFSCVRCKFWPTYLGLVWPLCRLTCPFLWTGNYVYHLATLIIHFFLYFHEI